MLGFSGGSNSKESACGAGDLGSVPGLGRSWGKRNGNLLKYSCQKNSVNRGAWRATVHRDSPQTCKESEMTEQLSNFHLCSRNMHHSRLYLIFREAFPDFLLHYYPLSFLFRSVCLSYQTRGKGVREVCFHSVWCTWVTRWCSLQPSECLCLRPVVVDLKHRCPALSKWRCNFPC